MDPVTSVLSITINIAKFISEHGDKTLLQEQIVIITTQIQEIIKPLLVRKVQDEALSDVLKTLNTELISIDNHLRSWKTSWTRRTIAFCYPWAVTQEIRDDTQQLMIQFQLLEVAMTRTTYDFIRGFNVLPSTNNASTIPVQPSTSANSHNHDIHNSVVPDENEVLRFWHTRIGGDVCFFLLRLLSCISPLLICSQQQEIAKSQRLCDDLGSWLNINLKGLARSRLLLRLDESNSGNVTLRTLQALVRDKKLREAIVMYSSGTVHILASYKPKLTPLTLDPGFPLLIWISDDLKINAPKVAFAQKQGVTVIQLANTASAKAWINVNKGKIRLSSHKNKQRLEFSPRISPKTR